MKPTSYKHQYLYIALGIIGMVLAGASHVSAQPPASTTPSEQREAFQDRREEVRDTAGERRQEFQENTDARREAFTKQKNAVSDRITERRAALSDRMQDRITNLANNMIHRMTAAIERLRNIIGRIQSRADKLEERGVATATAEGFLDDALGKLNEAETILTSLSVRVEDAATSDTPRDAFVSVRERFIAARDLIRDTHGLLRDAVTALKAAIAGEDFRPKISDAAVDTNQTDEADTEETKNDVTNENASSTDQS